MTLISTCCSAAEAPSTVMTARLTTLPGRTAVSGNCTDCDLPAGIVPMSYSRSRSATSGSFRFSGIRFRNTTRCASTLPLFVTTKLSDTVSLTRTCGAAVSLTLIFGEAIVVRDAISAVKFTVATLPTCPSATGMTLT